MYLALIRRGGIILQENRREFWEIRRCPHFAFNNRVARRGRIIFLRILEGILGASIKPGPVGRPGKKKDAKEYKEAWK